MEAPYLVDPSRALPASSYREQSYPAEKVRVWANSWVFVGTADQVAAPGDYFATTVADQPIVVLRNEHGDLAALSNMCAHRGTLLVEGAGNTKRFQCPYHAWTYASDGRLLSVPYSRLDEVDREQHCLPKYRAQTWQGLVFVTLSADIADLAPRLAHLDPVIEPHGLESLHHWADERTHQEWDANWKLVVANAMESYHLFKVHPKTLEPYSPTADGYYIVGSADGTATGGASLHGDDYILISLPPNFVGVITNKSLLWQAVEPLAHDRSLVITGGAYQAKSPSEDSGLSKWFNRAAAKATSAVTPDFLPEDKEICERGQRSAIGDFEPGPILAVEQVLVDFHHFLARQLHGAEVPPPRTSAEVGIARPPT